jgi:hypothetical protein
MINIGFFVMVPSFWGGSQKRWMISARHSHASGVMKWGQDSIHQKEFGELWVPGNLVKVISTYIKFYMFYVKISSWICEIISSW